MEGLQPLALAEIIAPLYTPGLVSFGLLLILIGLIIFALALYGKHDSSGNHGPSHRALHRKGVGDFEGWEHSSLLISIFVFLIMIIIGIFILPGVF